MSTFRVITPTVDKTELWNLTLSSHRALSPLTYHRNPSIPRLERNGSWMCVKAGGKGNQANGVGNPAIERERQVNTCPALLDEVNTLPSSGWVSWHPRRFEWTGPIHWKTKTSLCAIAITFQTTYTNKSLTMKFSHSWSDWGFHVPDSSAGIATRYGMDGPGIESRWGREFPYPSRPTLGRTQPPIQWAPGLSRG
jgi:hypothetical protein